MKEQNLLRYKSVDDLVSIILPTFNSEKYLDSCLKSITRQTYPNMEIIIIDGYSSDNTSNIIKNYEREINIKLIKKKTKNLAEALNIAIGHSRGEYIARMDSDDLMTNNRIKNQVKYFKKHNFKGVLGTKAFRYKKYFLKPFLLNTDPIFLKFSIFF